MNRAVHVAAILIVRATAAGGQEPAPTYRTDVNLLSLAVRLTDRKNVEIRGLTADRFSLYEDGIRQQITFFAAEEEPLSLGMLLGVSNSMAATGKLDAARQVLARLTATLGGQDEVLYLQFHRNVDKIVDFTSDRQHTVRVARIVADGRLEPSSGCWSNSGMASPGESWTLGTWEYPSDGAASLLSDILEAGEALPQYCLSSRACRGILRHAEKRGRRSTGHRGLSKRSKLDGEVATRVIQSRSLCYSPTTLPAASRISAASNRFPSQTTSASKASLSGEMTAWCTKGDTGETGCFIQRESASSLLSHQAKSSGLECSPQITMAIGPLGFFCTGFARAVTCLSGGC